MDSRVEMRVLAPNKIYVAMNKIQVTINGVSLLRKGEVSNSQMVFGLYKELPEGFEWKTNIVRLNLVQHAIPSVAKDEEEEKITMNSYVDIRWKKFMNLLSVNSQVTSLVRQCYKDKGFGFELQSLLEQLLASAKLGVVYAKLEADEEEVLNDLVLYNPYEKTAVFKAYTNLELAQSGSTLVSDATFKQSLTDMIPESLAGEAQAMLVKLMFERKEAKSINMTFDLSEQSFGGKNADDDADDADGDSGDDADADAKEA